MQDNEEQVGVVIGFHSRFSLNLTDYSNRKAELHDAAPEDQISRRSGDHWLIGQQRRGEPGVESGEHIEVSVKEGKQQKGPFARKSKYVTLLLVSAKSFFREESYLCIQPLRGRSGGQVISTSASHQCGPGSTDSRLGIWSRRRKWEGLFLSELPSVLGWGR